MQNVGYILSTEKRRKRKTKREDRAEEGAGSFYDSSAAVFEVATKHD